MKTGLGGRSKLVVTARGGLGNQLFSYSLGLELARQFELDLVVDTSMLPSTQDSVGGVSRFPSELQNFAHEGRVKASATQPFGKTNARSKLVTVLASLAKASSKVSAKAGIVVDSNLNDFLQNSSLRPKWIPDLIIRGESALTLRSDIQSQIRALKSPSQEYRKLSYQIREASPVAVHLREGDFRNLRNLYGPSNPQQYISESLNILSSSDEIWVFSDSPDSVNQRDFGGAEVTAITAQSLASPLETLLLMSQATGLVGANSTFSWWAALLGGERFRATFPFFAKARHNISNLVAPTENTTIISAQKP